MKTLYKENFYLDVVMFSDFLWVAEETCEVILEISNPLPIDLDVTNIVSIIRARILYIL